MKFNIDSAFTFECFKDIISVPSPTGYDVELKPVLESYANKFGKTITYDKKGTPYIELDGEDNSKTVMIGAHADTLGFMVKSINSDGTLRISTIGGLNHHSAEGESVTVHTRTGKKYTGICACEKHSTHVFKGSGNHERNEDTMIIILDENVTSKDDVKNLGINNGDYISLDPSCRITDNGYIKSRFIDDKGGIACVLTMLKYLNDNNLKPKYKTLLSFPFYEETGTGGGYVPDEVEEYIAVDIGLIGPGLDGNEYSVSICAKDIVQPYDYDLTNRMIEYAKKADCKYAVDVYTVYSSDACAAVKGGNNLRGAVVGMAVWCSHGVEKTHIEGMNNTTKLLLAYVLDI